MSKIHNAPSHNGALSSPACFQFNVAPSKDVFCKYDLKGSTYKRTERSSDQHIKDKSSLTSQWDPNTKHGQYSGVLLDLDFEEDSLEFERPVVVSLQDKEKLLAQILQVPA